MSDERLRLADKCDAHARTEERDDGTSGPAPLLPARATEIQDALREYGTAEYMAGRCANPSSEMTHSDLARWGWERASVTHRKRLLRLIGIRDTDE